MYACVIIQISEKIIMRLEETHLCSFFVVIVYCVCVCSLCAFLTTSVLNIVASVDHLCGFYKVGAHHST